MVRPRGLYNFESYFLQFRCNRKTLRDIQIDYLLTICYFVIFLIGDR